MHTHMTPVLGATLFVLGTIVPAAAQQPETEGPFTDLLEASKLIEKQRLPEAEKLLASVVEQIPKHAEAWHQLALCRLLQGKKDTALAAAKRAVLADPVHVRALVMTAQLAFAEDREYAAELATRAIKAAKNR